MKEFELQELDAATGKFSESKLIGKGSHGSVYRGTLKEGKEVAIKKQSFGLQKLQDNSKLENEAIILSSLPPNSSIINLLGTSHDAFNNKILVMDYMPNGTLHKVLHSSSKPPPWLKRVQIAFQIAKGIRFLHGLNPPIVHRDIKSCNILFDDSGNAKLADFGLAVMLSSDKELNLPAGTLGYLDPEYVTPSKLSTKIDVFSYGVVLLELISGRKAINMDKSPAAITEWAVPLIRGGETKQVFDERVQVQPHMEATIKLLLNIAAHCVSPMENIRPSLDEIVKKLEKSTPIEPVRFSLSMLNCFHGVILNLRRLKFRGTKCDSSFTVTTSGGQCGGDNRENCHGGVSKRTLLKEILADFALE